jgi:membrane protease YdiL (CAAX protease family)
MSVAVVVAISIIYSVLLFLVTSPRMSETAKQAFGVSALEPGNTMSIQAVLVVLAFAVSEEIFFRLGIQNFLAKHLGWRERRYWLAIAVTALLWTLGHAGTLEPGWVKLAQIFPVGLMLGWLSRRHGVESSILAHGLFNVVLLFPSSFLID